MATAPLKLETHLHAAICRAPKRGKSENLRVMLVGQIVDPSKDRHVRIDYVFGDEIYEWADCNPLPLPMPEGA